MKGGDPFSKDNATIRMTTEASKAEKRYWNLHWRLEKSKSVVLAVDNIRLMAAQDTPRQYQREAWSNFKMEIPTPEAAPSPFPSSNRLRVLGCFSLGKLSAKRSDAQPMDDFHASNRVQSTNQSQNIWDSPSAANPPPKAFTKLPGQRKGKRRREWEEIETPSLIPTKISRKER
jgi:hypothetical protein